MEKRAIVLGIDIGSVSISVAGINENGEMACQGTAFHHGNIPQGLEKALNSISLSQFNYIAVTEGTPASIKRSAQFDDQVAIIRAARHFHDRVGAILHVGGERFSLSLFDEDRNYIGARNNTSCAAGTGSFLDQQSTRLGLLSPQELSQAAFENDQNIPDIATRCAVFAKTDLIHAQQEGFSVPQICDGLCKGLAKNIYNTLFTNEEIRSPVIFSGGVSRNASVKKHLESLVKSPLISDDHSHLYGAVGAALSLQDALAKGHLQKNQDGASAVDNEENLTAFNSSNASPYSQFSISSPHDLLMKEEKQHKFFYPELDLHLSDYPDFTSFKQYLFEGVETDIYIDPTTLSHASEDHGAMGCYLGLDVGSTSTKGVLTSTKGTVMAGFYTRTASRPVQAVQSIFKALDHFIAETGLHVNVNGCGTTGSGRKLSAGIIGADLVLDEITAHSRAAFELNPEVDTIIEIGGQDAKFTTMKNGVVTSSFMNTVCAAGTGSFIEEQASKLGCPLSAYSSRTESVKSPVSSDRCTVFMERDMNHFLSEGYSVDEVLASALHSVRDNYMTKVATEAKIGETILFQGATAKNRALVAAFEQRLKKPLHVSKFCHLTGALGVALTLKDLRSENSFYFHEKKESTTFYQANESEERQSAVMDATSPLSPSKFRGFDLWKKKIPVRQETCRLCTNHCKLTVVEMPQETVAFGFLCGRDYNTDHFVAKEKSFHLLKSRKKAVTLPHPSPIKHHFTLGLPAALHMVEDIDFWKVFFNYLGVKTISSEPMKSPVHRGRSLANAEFCTPLTSLHGHVDELMEKADYVFLPFYFENKTNEKKTRRQYCYYTQYAPTIISSVSGMETDRLISPLIKDLYTNFHTKRELYKSLKKIPGARISFFDITAAHDKALEWKKRADGQLKALYTTETAPSTTLDEVEVVLVGRPYTILSDSLNSKIPDIFSSLHVKAFFQDMLDLEHQDYSHIEPLLKEIHWQHAATILKATLVAARTPNLFPVYVTSFKCSPDAFGVDYFKKIMEAHDKPYLVLELDEHDSSVGYETRIEAAVRAFKNFKTHGRLRSEVNLSHLNPEFADTMKGKTVIMPNWDPITCHFLTATLKGEGFDAILMEETQETIKQSLKTNTGQCIPLNAIASGYAQTIINHNLDPEKCVLWMSRSEISCNIKLYPHHIKSILSSALSVDNKGSHAPNRVMEISAKGPNRENSNQGILNQKEPLGFSKVETINSNSSTRLGKAAVYKGNFSLSEISMSAAVNAYFSHMFGGLLRALGCRIRPYEKIKGETDRAIAQAVNILTMAFEGKSDREETLKIALSFFEKIETHARGNRPKVGIFGDMYVRDNDVMNQDLVHFIEAHGGEVVTTPYYRFAKMIAGSYFKKWFKEGHYMSLLSYKALLTAMTQMEKRYYRHFEPLFNEPDKSYTDDYETVLAQYGLKPEHTGESMENLLKIHYTMKAHPDLALFVQATPSFCCPGLVTEAMASKIEKRSGVPVVSVTYDALGGNKNRVIIPFLEYGKDASPDHDNTIKRTINSSARYR